MYLQPLPKVDDLCGVAFAFLILWMLNVLISFQLLPKRANPFPLVLAKLSKVARRNPQLGSALVGPPTNFSGGDLHIPALPSGPWAPKPPERRGGTQGSAQTSRGWNRTGGMGFGLRQAGECKAASPGDHLPSWPTSVQESSSLRHNYWVSSSLKEQGWAGHCH